MMIRRILLALPLAAFGAFWFWFLTAPWPLTLPFRDPSTTSFMRMRVDQAEAAGEDFEIDYRPVSLARIAPAMQRAVVVAEDGRFHEHDGVDWHALAEEVRWSGDDEFSMFSIADLGALFNALRYYRSNSEKIRGRSTITQQLAKNLYFSADRSLMRKLEELIVARRLEWFLSKDRILELYLNTSEFGSGIFGVEAAAQRYFDVSAADLSRYQAATLAATLPHPRTSNPERRPGRMAWRRDMILGRMGGSGPVETVPLGPGDIEIEDPDFIGDPVEEAEPAQPAEPVEPMSQPVAEPDSSPEPAAPTPVDTIASPPPPLFR